MNHRLAKTYRRRRSMAGLVVLFVLIFIGFQVGFFNKISPVFSNVLKPIWVVEDFTKDFLTSSVSSKRKLFVQNELLQDAFKTQNLQLQKYNSVVAENKELKSILNRLNDNEYVLANILAKPVTTPYGTLVLDVGTKHGVKPDDLVLANGDVILGEIESVTINSSKVVMYSAPGNISQVVLRNSGRYFNAHGRGNGSFQVSVPREVEIEEGDRFIYPALDSNIIGIVRHITFDPRDSFKKVIFKSPINIQELRWVQVRIES